MAFTPENITPFGSGYSIKAVRVNDSHTSKDSSPLYVARKEGPDHFVVVEIVLNGGLNNRVIAVFRRADIARFCQHLQMRPRRHDEQHLTSEGSRQRIEPHQY